MCRCAQIRDVDITHFLDRYIAARIGTAGMPSFVATTGGEGEGLVAAADAVQKVGLFDQMLSDRVGDAIGTIWSTLLRQIGP
jgi:hypothetical protein